MKQKFWYPIVYMFVVTACFSAVIIGFAQLTKDRVQANQQIAFEKAILDCLPIPKLSIAKEIELHEDFQRIEKPTAKTGGAYVYRVDGQIYGYALPIEGQGFWAPIKGVIGIAVDKKTLINLIIYEQRETPGLGAEIAQRPFMKQFYRVVMDDGGKPINFRRPGETLEDNEVHAVTGATQTSTRLEKIINDALNKWRQEVETQ